MGLYNLSTSKQTVSFGKSLQEFLRDRLTLELVDYKTKSFYLIFGPSDSYNGKQLVVTKWLPYC
jgi:hypothetical protein